MPDMNVEVVYALADVQEIVALRVQGGTRAQEAVELSGLCEGRTGLVLGLFGQRIPPLQVLRDGDRVEILRPLAADPKEARRRRAKRRG
ncbi:MAG: RnfH family protein [Burkholderiales bacterium]